MIKRVVWFVSGIVTGVAAVLVGGRKVKRRVARVTDLTPLKVVRSATSSVRERVADVNDAVRDGRDAMRAKETELRARVDGRASRLDDELSPDDAVLVDGRPVEPGRVVVLRQIDPGFSDSVVPPRSTDERRTRREPRGRSRR